MANLTRQENVRRLLAEYPSRPAGGHRSPSIDIAEHYVKTSKGPIRAYWIQGPPGNSQYIHYVIDGSDMIYSVVGAITPQLYRAILNRLVIRPVP